MDKTVLVTGDITQLEVDAIVNAANSTLLGGGGVDGAIHRAAGPGLLEECRTLGGCPTGEARITGGHNLRANYVIHTVGPVWKGGKAGEERMLQKAYENSMELASKKGLKRIAFPNISTGIYGFPKEKAAAIAIEAVQDFIAKHPEIEQVIFCTFDEENHRIYNKYLPESGG